jgi:uncharacterized glyoxalase superfamily protein PhnB
MQVMTEKRIPGPIVKSEAIFAVADVATTVKFYREKLGFTKEWFWNDPPTHGGVQWGEVDLMFHLDAGLAKHVEGHQHYFHVKGVDDLYARHQQNGVQIISPLERKPWGEREYTIRDPNGYHLRFGEPPRTDLAGS